MYFKRSPERRLEEERKKGRKADQSPLEGSVSDEMQEYWGTQEAPAQGQASRRNSHSAAPAAPTAPAPEKPPGQKRVELVMAATLDRPPLQIYILCTSWEPADPNRHGTVSDQVESMKQFEHRMPIREMAEAISRIIASVTPKLLFVMSLLVAICLPMWLQNGVAHIMFLYFVRFIFKLLSDVRCLAR